MPHIDGLRAIAVLAVIVYHLNEHWLPGGFAGVDVFFVISGFVVSASVGDRARSSFLGFCGYFYARRMLRILPALIVCLLATHVAAMLFIPSVWLSATSRLSGLCAFFGFSNFVLAQGSDYFSPLVEFNPYTHTWSLGVEEQFYLIFPPLFAAWFVGARGRRLSSCLFSLGLVASLVCAWAITRTHPDAAFYLLFSRFWELAAGVLLYQVLVGLGRSFSEHGRPATAVPIVAAVVSLALLTTAFVVSQPKAFPFPGALLPAIGTLGVLGFLHGRKHNVVSRALGSRALVFVGKISYSLYLWHWPVFVIFRWTVGLDDFATRAIAVAITFALSTASFAWVEQPPRRSARIRGVPRLAVLVAGAAILGVASLGALAINAQAPRFSLSSVTRNIDDWYPHLAAVPAADPACRFETHWDSIGNGVRWFFSRSQCGKPGDNPQRLFVLGDSHAFAYIAMLKELAIDTDIEVQLYNNAGCPFLSLQSWRDSRNDARCPHEGNAALATILREARPGDILFLPSLRVNRFTEQFVKDDEKQAWAMMVGPAALTRRADSVREAIEVLKPFAAKGLKIVLEAPKPVLRSPPFRCADWFNATNPICAAGLDISREEMERYREPVMDAYRQIERGVGVSVWDPLPLLCSGEVCSAYRGGRPLYFDGDHISAFANRLLLPNFENYLRSLTADTLFKPSVP